MWSELWKRYQIFPKGCVVSFIMTLSKVAFRKITLPKLSLLVFHSGLLTCCPWQLTGFLQEAKRQQDTAWEKELLGATSTQIPPVPGDAHLANAAYVVLFPTEAAFQDYTRRPCCYVVWQTTLGDCLGERLMPWEMEAFQSWVIFKRPCGQNNSFLADSSDCCLEYPSHGEGLLSDSWIKILGQQHVAKQHQGWEGFRTAPAPAPPPELLLVLCCTLERKNLRVFDLVLLFPVIQSKLILELHKPPLSSLIAWEGRWFTLWDGN